MQQKTRVRMQEVGTIAGHERDGNPLIEHTNDAAQNQEKETQFQFSQILKLGKFAEPDEKCTQVNREVSVWWCTQRARAKPADERGLRGLGGGRRRRGREALFTGVWLLGVDVPSKSRVNVFWKRCRRTGQATRRRVFCDVFG